MRINVHTKEYLAMIWGNQIMKGILGASRRERKQEREREAERERRVREREI